MDPISNVDQIVSVLRQRLLERARAAAGPKGRKDTAANADTKAGIQALAAIEAIDDRQFKRALIQNVLAEQLGPALINDAKFQQVVDRVVDALEDDPHGSALLSGLVKELRAQAR